MYSLLELVSFQMESIVKDFEEQEMNTLYKEIQYMKIEHIEEIIDEMIKGKNICKMAEKKEQVVYL